MVGLALAGTAFFFCDALITPAISVLSAVEGLELLDPDGDVRRRAPNCLCSARDAAVISDRQKDIE